MRIRILAVAVAGVFLAGAGRPEANEAKVKEQRPPRSTVLRLPRDGNVAIRQELDAARRAGTLTAYDLFLARHPDHRLAKSAWRERAAIAARSAR
jgi:hypothetical protein